MSKQLVNYDHIISPENLLSAWREFIADKKSQPDVQNFSLKLMDNIFKLHDELSSGRYRHGPYSTFHIYDRKHRVISKALVRDRLIHHVVFNELYRIFDPTFIFHSYSSRVNKGTHIAVQNVAKCLRKVSRNYTKTTHVLRCDIKKFFWSVDHQKLLAIIQNKIKDEKILQLINKIVGSFPAVDKIPERERERERELNALSFVSHGFKPVANESIVKPVANKPVNKGLPIGNVTSQIFANIYLDKLDQFIKHGANLGFKTQISAKAKTQINYFRYADDFVIIHDDQNYLNFTLTQIGEFLQSELLLELHPGKVSICKFRRGVDFLGYVVLPRYTVLRTKTKKRMIKKIRQRKRELEQDLIAEESFNQSLQSYLGMLKHCQGRKVEKDLLKLISRSRVIN